MARTPAAIAAPDTLRVMSYNIAAGRFGLARVAAAIRTERPDVVGLQEVDVDFGERSGFMDQARALADSLGLSVFFAPIYTLPPPAPHRPPRRFGVAVLSRCGVVEARNRDLTRLSTQEPGSVPRRMPGLADVVLTVGGRRVRVLDTHLDYRADPAVRRSQVSDLLRLLGPTDSLPTLLLGDLNAAPDAPELRPLLRRLRDAAAEAGGAGGTYPAEAPRSRIDYVLTSRDVRALSARTPPSGASDHRPLVVVVEIR